VTPRAGREDCSRSGTLTPNATITGITGFHPS
jgi:hypothetical protein